MQKKEVKEQSDKIERDLKKVVKMIEDNFGKDYAQKNPVLVMDLMGKIQQQEDRELTLLTVR